MTYYPFIVSLLIGLLINALLFRNTKSVSFALHFFLSVGLGLGLSSVITFFTFFPGNGFNRPLIILSNLLVFSVLIVLYNSRFKKVRSSHDLQIKDPIPILYCIAFVLFFIIIYLTAHKNPFGEWDSWALWNMKAKFLLLSGSSWRSLFHDFHWHTQPDYPLLLPYINVWGWSLLRKDFVSIPLLTSVIFTISCIGLLFASLIQYVNRTIAFLASCLLLFLPVYISLGISQYADIVLAYYLLASFVTLMIALREKDKGSAIACGLFLGLLSFTKNEGIIIAILILILSIFYLVFKQKEDFRLSRHLLLCLVYAFMAMASSMIVFKLSLAPINRDILLQNLFDPSKFLTWERCALIIKTFFFEIVHERWHALWIMAFLVAVFHYRKFFYREVSVLTFFFIFYVLFLFLTYITTINFDLAWRLSRTLTRILFYLLPTVIFSVLYALYRNNEAPEKNKPRVE